MNLAVIVVVLSFLCFRNEATVTMNRHGDLVLHSLMNGDVVFATGNGGIRVDRNGQTIDLLQALDKLNTVAGQLCWMTFPNRLENWEPESNLLNPLMDSAAVAVGKKIYVFGGSNGATTLRSVQIYDTTTQTWTYGPNMASPRSRAFAALRGDGKIFIFGGGDFGTGNTDKVIANPSLSNMEVFDTQTNTFVTSSVFTGSYNNTMPRYHFKGTHVVVDDKVIFIGGILSNGSVDSSVSSFSLTDLIWDLNWPSMDSPRSNTASAAVGNTIYVTGGFDGLYPSDKVTKLDAKNKIWKKDHEFGLAKKNSAAVNLEGLVILMGGWTEWTQDINSASSDSQVYNPKVELWKAPFVGEMNDAREGFSAVVVNDRIYIIGGRTNAVDTVPLVSVESVFPCY